MKKCVMCGRNIKHSGCEHCGHGCNNEFLYACPDCGSTEDLTTLEECIDYPGKVLSYCTKCGCAFNILTEEEYNKFNPRIDQGDLASLAYEDED